MSRALHCDADRLRSPGKPRSRAVLIVLVGEKNRPYCAPRLIRHNNLVVAILNSLDMSFDDVPERHVVRPFRVGDALCVDPNRTEAGQELTIRIEEVRV